MRKSVCRGIVLILLGVGHIAPVLSEGISLMGKFVSGEPVYHEATSFVPFELRSHDIQVPVTINGSKTVYRFLLDTGAMTWIDEDLAVQLGLEKGEMIQTLRKDKPAYLTMVRSLKLGEMEVRDFIIPRMDVEEIFDDFFSYDGFLGADFLRFFSVTIDYTEKTLTLADTSSTDETADQWISIPLTSTLPMWFPYLQGTMNDSIHAPIMVDTGSPFSLVIPLSFERRLCHSAGSECVRSEGIFAKWPSTDPPYNVYTRLHSLQIGDHVVEFLPALLTDLPMMVNVPLMGKAFLDKYRIRLDFPHGMCHLMPIPGTDHETNVYTRGIHIRTDDLDSLVVGGIWNGSPADKMGLLPGDHILSIQEIGPTGLTETIIDSILATAEGPSIHIRIAGKRNIRDIHLSKDGLFPDINP